jgi:hypothetical protein
VTVPTWEDFAVFAPDPVEADSAPRSNGSHIAEGGRNRTLASLAGSMRRKGATLETILAALRIENAARCRPPLADKEIEKIARSIARYEPTATPPRVQTSGTPVDRLGVVSIKEAAREIAAQPPVGFLAAPVWPADAYGVLAAEDKAGKTWALLDLAVAVASGTSWLGRYRCEQGPVFLLLGEGGKRRMVRRLSAVASRAGVEAGPLPIRASFRVPHLTNRSDLDAVAAELEANPAKLVVLDPLYLAARGANGALLYEMGEHLENLQQITQDAGAALVVATHYNKTGEGRGPKRITGAGPGAWGRVLVTVDVVGRHREPSGASVVTLAFEFIGDEIGEQSMRIRRRVWADDPHNLSSPMHYELEAADEDGPSDPAMSGLSPAAVRIHTILQAEGRELTVLELQDLTAAAGWPLKQRTIQNALNDLQRRGLAFAHAQIAPGSPMKWRAQTQSERA